MVRPTPVLDLDLQHRQVVLNDDVGDHDQLSASASAIAFLGPSLCGLACLAVWLVRVDTSAVTLKVTRTGGPD